MNIYLTKCKVDFIKQARDNFYKLTGVQHTPFTRKNFFYFFIYDNKKYVHKEALRFVYTNADTWTNDIDPVMCALTKETTPFNIIEFLEQCNSDLMPKLLDVTSDFLIYEYVIGEPCTCINSDEFFTLRKQNDELSSTPFYNSMAYNLIRSGDVVKLVDLKHFDKKDDKPFFVYFYNEDANINELHLSEHDDVTKITQYLGKDYPIQGIICHYH